MSNLNSSEPQTPRADFDDDFLKGAAAIAEHLRRNGLNVANTDVYYLAKSKKLAIGKFGKNLIASKRRLSRDLKRAAQSIPA